MNSIPIEFARYITYAIFGIIIIITVLFPAKLIMHDAPKKSRWYDLRIYAVLLAVIQIILYIVI